MNCPGCGEPMETTYSNYGEVRIEYWICYGCPEVIDK